MSGDHHLQLLEDAKIAANNLHNDTSVDKSTNLESLRELRDEVNVLIEALECGGKGDGE